MFSTIILTCIYIAGNVFNVMLVDNDQVHSVTPTFTCERYTGYYDRNDNVLTLFYPYREFDYINDRLIPVDLETKYQ